MMLFFEFVIAQPRLVRWRVFDETGAHVANGQSDHIGQARIDSGFGNRNAEHLASYYAYAALGGATAEMIDVPNIPAKARLVYEAALAAYALRWS